MNETVDIQDEEIIPTKNDFNLTNFPNPFNPSTTISFSVTQTPSIVELSIYNLKGQKVKTFAFPNGSLGTSEQNVVWNGTDDYNKPVSSGIYFINLKTNTNVKAVKKCLLIK